MKPVSTITSPAVPLLRNDIDTDMIFSSRGKKRIGRKDVADGAFARWRYLNGVRYDRDPNFVLNQRDAIGTRLLLTGINFGRGPNSEPAVWALQEFGIEAIIAPSFASMFKRNCIRNGLLPIELPREAVTQLQWDMVTIDLEKQTVTSRKGNWHFEIDPEARQILLQGLDPRDVSLANFKSAISRWLKPDRG